MSCYLSLSRHMRVDVLGAVAQLPHSPLPDHMAGKIAGDVFKTLKTVRISPSLPSVLRCMSPPTSFPTPLPVAATVPGVLGQELLSHSSQAAWGLDSAQDSSSAEVDSFSLPDPSQCSPPV